MNSKILVATHKQYQFPASSLYVPIHVGSALTTTNLGYLTDDTQENISSKNQSFCELTALYWAWKNNFIDTSSYVGLVHYRRYFVGGLTFGKASILSNEQLEHYLKEYDVITPKKRKYYVETVESHYGNAHYLKDLKLLRAVINETTPEYLTSFDQLMQERELYPFNMFVMHHKHFTNYMQWLFPLLLELEKRLDISTYNSYQSRIFGFLAERLFNVWLKSNNLKVKELKVIHLEGENLLIKAYNMLKRKFSNT